MGFRGWLDLRERLAALLSPLEDPTIRTTWATADPETRNPGNLYGEFPKIGDPNIVPPKHGTPYFSETPVSLESALDAVWRLGAVSAEALRPTPARRAGNKVPVAESS